MAVDDREGMDMEELSGSARELLDAARTASTPTAADRARVWSALEAQLGAPAGGVEGGSAEAGGGSTGSAGSAGSGKLAWVVVITGLAGLAAVAGIVAGGMLSGGSGGGRAETETRAENESESESRAENESESESRAETESESESRAENESGAETETESRAETESESELEAGAGRRSVPTVPEADIAGDVALLHRAQAAWRGGSAAEALQLAEEHRATYPRSALGHERDAIRVLALCALGRQDSARRIATRLLASAGASPWRQAVTESCGGQ